MTIRSKGRGRTRLAGAVPRPKLGAFCPGWWLALLTPSLVACQTAPGTADYSEFSSSRDPASVAALLSENVSNCWFGGRRDAFAKLIYVPELASLSNRPRVLIVQEADPTGLPKLVIEASAAERGSSVKLFGPLMATAEAAAISRDVERWAGGVSGC